MAAIVLTLLLLGAAWIYSLFHLSSDARALRNSALGFLNRPDHMITLHANGVTVGLVRAVAGFFPLDPEPRAALGSFQALEAGVYTHDSGGRIDRVALLQQADEAMKRRGWERAVEVIKNGNLVAAYFPQRPYSNLKTKCCVLVLNDYNLVIVSAEGDLQPLMSLIESQFDQEMPNRKVTTLTKR